MKFCKFKPKFIYSMIKYSDLQAVTADVSKSGTDAGNYTVKYFLPLQATVLILLHCLVIGITADNKPLRRVMQMPQRTADTSTLRE